MTDTPYENQIVQATPATLTLDVALYEHYLEQCPMSAKEKQELLQTLWGLICEFVYLGFGISPVQQVIQEACRPTESCSALNSVRCGDLDQVESPCNERGEDHA